MCVLDCGNAGQCMQCVGAWHLYGLIDILVLPYRLQLLFCDEVFEARHPAHIFAFGLTQENDLFLVVRQIVVLFPGLAELFPTNLRGEVVLGQISKEDLAVLNSLLRVSASTLLDIQPYSQCWAHLL